MAQRGRVGGQGDQGLGGQGDQGLARFRHKARGAAAAFWRRLPSSLALLFASSEDTPAETFRVPAVGCQASTWQVGAEGRAQPSLSGHWPRGICLFDPYFFCLEDCHVLTLL